MLQIEDLIFATAGINFANLSNRLFKGEAIGELVGWTNVYGKPYSLKQMKISIQPGPICKKSVKPFKSTKLICGKAVNPYDYITNVIKLIYLSNLTIFFFSWRNFFVTQIT